MRARVLFHDRMFPYCCEWGDDHTIRARRHYHAGHAPGATPQQPRLQPAPRMVRQPSRQMIIGLQPEEMDLLLRRAAEAGVQHARYAHDVLVAALYHHVILEYGEQHERHL